MQKILAIETSCDETSAAVVDTAGQIHSIIISSQIDTHKDYGGVIPEIASRMHVEAINLVIEKALNDAQTNIKEISAIAVTQGPGLLGALMIGIQAAKTLSYIHNIPLIGVNHMEGHIMANFLTAAPPQPSPQAGREQPPTKIKIRYPFICLVVSGGHTQIVIAKGAGDYHTIGRTIDDAAGEAYDKVARLLQLGYPGGPIIDKLAKTGNENAIKFGQAKIKAEGNEFNFSFSGLKTAVINHLRKYPETKPEDLSASFQKTVVDTLLGKTIAAAKKHKINDIYLAGGVSANSALRSAFETSGKKEGFNVGYPPLKLCTDNAAMIGGVAIHKLLNKEFSELDIKALPNLKL